MIEDLSATESAALVADVGRFIPDLQNWTSSTHVRRKPLSCYRDYALVRIADGDARHRPLLGLYAPGDFWPLDRIGVETVNKLSPLHLTRETAGDYAVLFLGFPTDGLTRDASTAPDRAGFLVRQSDGRQLLIPLNGHLPIGMARVPRVAAILGVKEWTTIAAESEEAQAVLQSLHWGGSLHENMEFLLRKANISFYREHGLFELLTRRKAAITFQQYYFLWHPKWTVVRPLYGESQPIHQANSEERPLLATETAVAEYLRFFCWATGADQGRFLPVERFRDIPWAKAPSDRDRQTVARQLKPIGVTAAAAQGEHDSAWDCSATVAYGRNVFKASFVVSGTGLVQMTDDQPLDGPLPITRLEPARLTADGFLASGGDPQDLP